MRTVIGAVFLLLQLGWMIAEQRGPSRYFCWAPNDAMTEYRLAVQVGGRALTDAEIAERYRVPARGLDETVPQHLFDFLEQRERSLERHGHAAVTVRYRVNGREEQQWHRP